MSGVFAVHELGEGGRGVGGGLVGGRRGVEAGRCIVSYVVHRLSAPGDRARAVGLHREVVVVEGSPEYNIDIYMSLSMHALTSVCV